MIAVNVIANELNIRQLTNEVQRLQQARDFSEARQVFQKLVAAVSNRTAGQVHELESAKGLACSTGHAL